MFRRDDRGQGLAILSFGLAVAAAAVLFLAPLGTRRSAVLSSGDEVMVGDVEHVSLLQTEGAGVLVVLSVPVLIAAIGVAASLVADRRIVRVVSAVLLGVFVVLGAMSVGVFYVPSAVAMAVAAVRTDPAYS